MKGEMPHCPSRKLSAAHSKTNRKKYIIMFHALATTLEMHIPTPNHDAYTRKNPRQVARYVWCVSYCFFVNHGDFKRSQLL